jgi:ATP-dependent Clp protease ATP-binding subunit ClpA
MKKLDFPLLCFPLKEDAVLGVLVGTEFQVVERNVRRVKTMMTEHLQKEYKKEGEYPEIGLKAPALKMIEASLRPTLRQANSAFPLSYYVKIATPLVFGEDEPGVYQCYLPLLDETFYCYDLRQLDALARHFVVNSLNEASPDEVYRHARYPHPTLELVSLKVKDDPLFSFSWNVNRKSDLLERLAERYPLQKSVQRNLSAFPDAAWELEEYVAQVVEKLIGQRASVLVVGNSGVGKSAVLRQAIKKITTTAKKQKLDYSCWRMQAQRITATSKYLGEWQETVEGLIWELANVNGMLWVEDIMQLLKEGGRRAEDSVAAYLLPFIQEGRLQLMGETTPQELESIRRLLPGFVESVMTVEIPELPEKKIHLIFEKFTGYVRQNLKINIGREASAQAFRLLKRFYPYESFPGKGVRFLSECVNDAMFHQVTEIHRKEVVTQFIRRTGLPELFLRDDLLLDQEELRRFFQSRIIGQEMAIDKLCDIVKVFKAGLNNPHKPITTLIFAGPTGVGKTASALALAAYFFGLGQRQMPLIRLDMSEFQHPGQLIPLIGSGGEPGKLVADVRERPFSVLLLDEAEKADPSIYDALLNLFDEGMMVDAYGRITNFRNCIIILTTNLGASQRPSIGYGNRSGEAEAAYLGAISRFFRPEFMNRIDNVVMFQALGQKEIRLITLKELEAVKKREGFQKRGLNVLFTDRIVEFLATAGFHEKFGARPLQRAIEEEVIRPLAAWLLKKPTDKQKTIEVDYDKETVIKIKV